MNDKFTSENLKKFNTPPEWIALLVKYDHMIDEADRIPGESYSIYLKEGYESEDGLYSIITESVTDMEKQLERVSKIS